MSDRTILLVTNTRRPEAVEAAQRTAGALLDRGLAEDQRYVAGNFIKCLSGLAMALRHMPGQKHLVLLSGGLSPKMLSANWNLRRAYTDLCRDLASANITVFPISTDPLTLLPRTTVSAPTASMAPNMSRRFPAIAATWA